MSIRKCKDCQLYSIPAKEKPCVACLYTVNRIDFIPNKGPKEGKKKIPVRVFWETVETQCRGTICDAPCCILGEAKDLVCKIVINKAFKELLK